MMNRGLVLWALDGTPNLGVAALARGTEVLGRSVWPSAGFDTQYFRQGPAGRNIAAPKTLFRDLVLGDRGLKTWLRGYDVVLDTRMGDSFADIYGLERLRYLVAMGEFVRRCDVPLALTPQTVGPFRTAQGGALGRFSLRRADLVLCRDPVSAACAADFGARDPVLTTDVVFALERPEPDGSHDVMLNVSGLLWNSDDHGSADAYRANIENLIEALLASGREVSVLAHVLDSPSVDNDVPAAREVGERWHLPVVVPTGLDAVRGILRGSNLLIGSRMHACLNSLSVGTPAIALAYSRKFGPLMAQLGWEAVIDLATPDAGNLAAELAATDLRAEVDPTLRRAAELLDAARSALRDLA